MTETRYQMSRYVLRCQSTCAWTVRQHLRGCRGLRLARLPQAESRCCGLLTSVGLHPSVRSSSTFWMQPRWLSLQKPRTATVDEFIARMAPLLDMERDAEVAQVHLPVPANLLFEWCSAAPRAELSQRKRCQAVRCPCSFASSWRHLLMPMLSDAALWCMQAGDALARMSPQAAQARGQVLLNLRCSQSESGLLGRTLLTLISNKVQNHRAVH